MPYGQRLRLPDGQELGVYSEGNTSVGIIRMSGNTLEINGDAGGVLIGSDAKIRSGNNLVFQGSTGTIGGTNTTISLGFSGDTIAMDVAGVTYKLPKITGNVEITGNLTLKGSDLNLGGTTTYVKNGTLDMTNSKIYFARDTDWASIEYIDYGSDNDQLTITFGDRSNDFVRFRNFDGTNNINIMDITGNHILAYKPIKYTSSTNTPALILEGATTGWASGIQFKNTTPTTGRSWGIYSRNDGNFIISDETASATRLDIDSTGKVRVYQNLDVDGIVGIGTDPISGYQLTLSGSGKNLQFKMHSNGVDIYSTGNMAPHYQTDFTWYTGVPGSGTLRMRLDSNGRLGIGSTTPNTMLDIAVPSTGTTLTGTNRYAGIHLDQTSTNDEFVGITTSGTTTGTQGGILFQGSGSYGTKIHFLTTDSYAAGMKLRMTLDNAGKLGIGTSSPAKTLDVVGDIKLSGGLYNDSSTINFLTTSGSAQGAKVASLVISSNYSNNAPTNGLYVQGNVGIGVTSPSEALHVTGNIKASGDLKSQNIYLGQTSGGEGSIYNIDILNGLNDIRFSFGGGGAVHVMNSTGIAINRGGSAPQFNVDVSGTIATDGLYYLSGTPGVYREAGNMNLLSRLSGRLLNKNPDFFLDTAGGGATTDKIPTGYAKYDNNNSGRVKIYLISDDTVPNSSGIVMRVDYDPARSGTTASPGFGGFHIAYSRDTGSLSTWGYRAGNRYLHRIIAKIPAGRSIDFATNSTGSGGGGKWLTSQAGTGDWQEYLYLQTIGNTGTFTTTGFYYVKNGADSAFTWDVSTVQVIGLDEIPDVDRAPTLNVGYKSGVNLNWGDIYATGNITSDVAVKSADFFVTTANGAFKSASGNSFFNPLNASNNAHIKAGEGNKTLYIDADTHYIRSSTGTNYLSFASGGAATFYSTLTANGNVTVGGGTLTVNKSGNYSTISFPAQTNDPGFIKHYENNNTAYMQFSVSDDVVDTDYFSFGAAPSGTFQEHARITASGKAYFKNLDLTWGGGITLRHSQGRGITIDNGSGSVSKIESVNGNDVIIRTDQLRLGLSGSGWDWDKWAGIKYDANTTTLTIGGPASSVFTSNASPPSITVAFDGISSVDINGTLKAKSDINVENERHVIIKGGNIHMQRPSTTGGWAKGIKWESTGGGAEYAGFGLYGSNTTITHLYLAHGASPWASGQGIYILPGGNVGVKTTTPSEALHVNGNIRADGGNTTWGNILLTHTSDWAGGSNLYPTVTSTGSGGMIVLKNPHLPYTTNNNPSGYSGSAKVRMAADGTASNYWDMGVYSGDRYVVSRNNTVFFSINNTGKAIFGADATGVAGRIVSYENGQNLSLVGTNHVYIAFYPGGASTRTAWIGYGSASSNELTLDNTGATGGITLQPGTNYSVSIGGTSNYRKLDVNGDSQFNGGVFINRASNNGAIWFGSGTTGTNTDHVLWNDSYGGPGAKGSAGTGWDGMKWNTYKGIHIRLGTNGQYNGLKVEGSGGSTNDGVVRLYGANNEKLTVSSSGVTVKDFMVYSTTNSSNYYDAAIEVREYNLGGAQTGAWSEAPAIAFNWSGRTAAQIAMDTSGVVSIRNSAGTGYSTFRAADMIADGNIRITSTDGRGVRFWDSDSYKIYMSTSTNGTWGGRLDSTSDYNMYFRMSSGTNRGFVFLNNTTPVAQIEGSGKIHGKGGFKTGKFEIVHNAAEDSLDFVYVG